MNNAVIELNNGIGFIALIIKLAFVSNYICQSYSLLGNHMLNSSTRRIGAGFEITGHR